MSKKITDKVWKMAEGFLSDMGLEVYDVVFVKEGNDKILRLYIDKIEEGYVAINECEEASMKLSELLDEDDFIAEAFVLEVSSPGVERIIKYGLENGYTFSVLDENSPGAHHGVNN